MELKPNLVGKDVVVSLDYVLTVDGEIADSTVGREPLPYLHGHGNLIEGLEKKLEGMQVGESKSVLVPAAEAYGEIDPEAYSDMDRSKFPEGFDFQIGKVIRLNAGDGRILSAQISNIGDDTIELDFNHPLAGKALNFDVTISDLREATEIELTHGRVNMGGCSSCGGGCDSCDSCG